jgi:nucleotide-binding universal stress UspA family protein
MSRVWSTHGHGHHNVELRRLEGIAVTRNEIVVGLDNSEPALAALRWAAAEARLSGSTVRAVHVSDWPTGVGADGRPLVAEELVLNQGDDIESAARSTITERFKEIGPEHDWSLQFARGKTGRVLVDAARDSRLLVVGTGEHVGLGRILLGSTSHYCLGHAFCPVVAVPAHEISLGSEPTPS